MDNNTNNNCEYCEQNNPCAWEDMCMECIAGEKGVDW